MLMLASTILIAAQMTGDPSPLVDRFDALKWSAPDGRRYAYRLYVPRGARPASETAEKSESDDSSTSHGSTEAPIIATAAPTPAEGKTDQRWPLLVWLHGEGERGGDNRMQLHQMPLIFAAMDDSPPLFILATQHPPNEPWYSSQNPEEDFQATTYKILEQTIADYPVDPDRVYVSGVSSGGTACWEFVCRHPERFAAAAPMASSGGDLSRAGRLKDFPIWAFHSSSDRNPSPDGAREMVQAITQAGGMAHLTETDSRPDIWTHDCWTLAFQDHQAMDWMLAQRRGAWFVYWRPGSSPFAWVLIIAWLAVIGLVGWACRRELQRRRRLQREAQILEQTGKTTDELLQTSPFDQAPQPR